MGKACSTNGEKKNAYSIFVRKPERKKALERWKLVNNIKMDLGEILQSGMKWIDLAEDMDRWIAFVISVLKCWVPYW
jgi:hypothetical protein